jgi:RNA polymerase sigma factor (sigma-70 family)
VNEKSELELLREFVQRRNEACFEEIVRRYVDLVYSAAVRLAADPHLAEDVSQAVFTTLAGQAGQVVCKLAAGAALSGWLHVTTRNLAAKTLRKETRRRNWEQEACAMHELSSNDSSQAWEQIAPHLDDALGDLAEADRDALLLRFFERKSARQIGERLGVSEEAAQKRVSRALERLRERFAARSAVIPGSACLGLAGLISAKSVHAAPAALSTSIAKAALLGATAASASLAASSGSGQIITLLAMTKSQTAILVSIAAVLLVPIAIQQSALNAARTSLNDRSALVPEQASNTAAVGLGRTRESESEEMARLRVEADDLRQKIAAQRQPPAHAAARSTNHEVQLALGKTAPIKDLNFVGNASPEAALQSLLAFRRDGDVDGAASLMLLPPDRAEKWNQILASPKDREQFAQEMVAATMGVVMHSAVKVDDQGNVVESSASAKVPDAPESTTTVELLEKASLDERRMQLSIAIIRGGITNIEHATFGLGQTGWKCLTD